MKYFTYNSESFYPFTEVPFAERQKLDNFIKFLDDSGVGEIIYEECHPGSNTGRKGYNPYDLFATILYAFSTHSGTLRKIQESIDFDIRFMYLMHDKKPSYVTISTFLNNVVVKHQKEIFFCLTKHLVESQNVCIDDVFLDGTKIEANCNKYSFVYKPTKHHANLNENIRQLLEKYFTISKTKQQFVSKEVANYLSELNELMAKQNIDVLNVKYGRGHHVEPIVKDYHILNQYLFKLLEYEEKERICGPNRNSYYKYDTDATAMCLKEDYYSGLGSNMHAAYTLEIMVSKGLILDYYVCQERSDQKTLIPCLESYFSGYQAYPKRLCADSGYGSNMNYKYLKEQGIENYVKDLYWEKTLRGESIELLELNENGDFLCLNGKVAKETNCYPRVRGNKIYLVTGCSYCRHKDVCGKTLKNGIKDERRFETSKEYYRFKQEARTNLLSPKGIEMRINRSAQVEGTFGVLKQDMEYDRTRRKGLENVSAEIMLTCLGYNLKKLFSIFEGKAKMDYWIAPENLEAEKPKEFSKKRYLKVRKKGANEQLRKTYKNRKF